MTQTPSEDSLREEAPALARTMVDTHEYEIYVVVETHPEDLALPDTIFQVLQHHEISIVDEEPVETKLEVQELPPHVWINFLQPVFKVGEVLILDPVWHREIGYPGRKPSKWRVHLEQCKTLKEAHEVSQAVLMRNVRHLFEREENQE